AEDDKGDIVGWAGLFKSSKFWSGIALLVSPEFISSNLPVKLLDSMVNLAETQKLTNLRLYVYGTFATLRNALDHRGIQSRSGDFTLILDKPVTISSVTIPIGISLRSSRNAENLAMYAETVNAAFREYASWQDTSDADLRELEQDLFESGYKESIHFYAYDEQKQIGLIHAAIHKPDHEGKRGLVVRLGVIPSHRRRGIGNTLLGKAIYWLFENGCSEIELSVIAENEQALLLYKNWGFKEIKEKTIYIYTVRPTKEKDNE
ncbi:MAG: GNAT family N-acetyltransferase, partial [Candidatus Hodarchaeota archaeon]